MANKRYTITTRSNNIGKTNDLYQGSQVDIFTTRKSALKSQADNLRNGRKSTLLMEDWDKHTKTKIANDYVRKWAKKNNK